MTVFIFWVLFSVAVGVLAKNRGRSGIGWFFLSVLISPLLGLIFCLVTKDMAKSAQDQALPSEATHVKCPHCAELVLPQALVCKHCGRDLVPDLGFAVRKTAQAAQSQKDDGQNLVIGIAFLFGLFAIAALVSKCSG